MGIYDDLLSKVSDGIADRVLTGPFITLVCSGEGCGLSTTQYPEGELHTAQAINGAGELAEKPLSELGRLVYSDKPMERSLGMAAINAGLPAAGLDFTQKDGAELLAEKAEGKRLAVVGHFAFVDRIASRAESVSVLELNPREGDVPACRAAEVIHGSDVVAITGSAFSNRTMEGLLEMARGRWVMVVGPTTPLSPVLFDYGVDALAGSVVEDTELTFQQAGQGAIFKQLTGIRKVLSLK